MYATNAGLNVLDALFTLLEKVSEIDCTKLGRTVIDKAIIATAVIVAVTTYVITACQLWWLTHSETIIISATRFVINTADFSREVFVMGQELRRFITKTLNLAADSAFFTIAGL
jgi:hypothetical protein